MAVEDMAARTNSPESAKNEENKVDDTNDKNGERTTHGMADRTKYLSLLCTTVGLYTLSSFTLVNAGPNGLVDPDLGCLLRTGAGSPPLKQDLQDMAI